jgi:hypothetical protein
LGDVQPFSRILKASGRSNLKKGAHRFDIHCGLRWRLS